MLNILGERLRIARERKDLTQIDVYKSLNINNKSLSRYENGLTAPDPDTIIQLSTFYGVSCDYLFGLTNDINSFNKQLKLSENEINLLLSFRKLSKEQQEMFIVQVTAVASI